MPEDLNLDVDSPEKVSDILRNAAQEYYEGESKLGAAWQDRQAGKI